MPHFIKLDTDFLYIMSHNCCPQDSGAITNTLLWILAIPRVCPFYSQKVMSLEAVPPLVSVYLKVLFRKSFLLDIPALPAIVLHAHR
jgi:hypothetical protein